jgi:hypothetical protein
MRKRDIASALTFGLIAWAVFFVVFMILFPKGVIHV